MAGEHPGARECNRACGNSINWPLFARTTSRSSFPHHPRERKRKVPDACRSRAGAYPFDSKRNQMGSLWAKRCRKTLGIEQVHASLPHEETWNRPPHIVKPMEWALRGWQRSSTRRMPDFACAIAFLSSSEATGTTGRRAAILWLQVIPANQLSNVSLPPLALVLQEVP